MRRWLHETTAAASGVVSAEPLEKSSVLVIGAGNIGHSIAREIRVHPELGMTLTGFVDDDHLLFSGDSLVFGAMLLAEGQTDAAVAGCVRTAAHVLRGPGGVLLPRLLHAW